MKSKFILALALAVLGAVATPSFAGDAVAANADKIYQLKDGGKLYVFKDGKMAAESQYGRSVFLNQGQVLETIDGQKITTNSNEVARLDSLLSEGHRR